MLIGAAHARMTRGGEGGAVWTSLGLSDSRSKSTCWVSPVSGAGKSSMWRTMPLSKAVGQRNGQATRHRGRRYRPEPYGSATSRSEERRVGKVGSREVEQV